MPVNEIPAPDSHAAAGDRWVTRRTAAVLLLAAVWCAALTVLTLAAANPVTLNRDQLLRSPVIVVGRVEDAATGAVTVERGWRSAVGPGDIRVTNLNETAAEQGQTYVLPLMQVSAGTFEVVPARLPRRPWLIYPSSPETIQQVTEIIGRPAGS